MKTKYIQIHCLRCLKNSILHLTPATSAKDSRHPHEEIGRFLWKHSEKVGCWQYPPHRGDGSKNVGNYMWEECMCRLGPKKISKRKYLHDSVEMWESARRCGAKHISKSKCLKTHLKKHLFGPLLEVECGKSERRCGTKHISKSKVLKTYCLGPLFDVQLSFFVASAMDSAPCQK